MRKTTLLLGIVLTLLFISYSFYIDTLKAQDETEEKYWDFEGIMRVQSDERRIEIFNPVDNGFNQSVQGYDRPRLYFSVLGLDTDEDEETDIYYGFYGINFYDVSQYNYTTAEISLFKIVVNAHWKLRIPDSSPLRWQVLYYPDPLYQEISSNLEFKTPIYYVNLTEHVGVNLEYRIDFGLNYTIGNFTTFGHGMPLVPSLGDSFPGYNVSVPLFTKTDLIEEVLGTSFFSSPIDFVIVFSMTFMAFYIIRKKRKRKLAKS
ncbi:MAG: hypothetical protein ACTSUR_00305 [Candidatus Heimdallarchaeaceae archaeon]